MIPTRIHGMLDYLVGAFLVVSPWVLGFWRNGAESWVPIFLGGGAIAYSLLTNYEMGAVRLLSMRAHLWLDAASGILLASSPWVFGFSEFLYVPHVGLGLIEVAVAVMTVSVPYAGRSRTHTPAHEGSFCSTPPG